MSLYSMQIPEGFRGTATTINLMRALACSGAKSDAVHRLAALIVQGLPRRDYEAEAAALLAWVQRNCRYVRDPWTPDGTERVQHPEVTLFETKSGDCDDLTVAYCALAGSIGFPYAFRTVGIDPRRPTEFSHVYALLEVDGKWRPVDPMFTTSYVGWEPPRRTAEDDRAGVPVSDSKIGTSMDWRA